METFLHLNKSWNIDVREMEFLDLATITSIIKKHNEEEANRRKEEERKAKAAKKTFEMNRKRRLK
jgi:hypothetical protein